MILIDGKKRHCLPVTDRAISYGDALFESCAVQGGRVLLWEYHERRLRAGVSRLKMPKPGRRKLRKRVAKAARICATGILKVTLTRGDADRGYAVAKRGKPRTIIQIWPHKTAPFVVPQWYRVGISSIILPTDPVLANIKHANRLHQVMAAIELRNSRRREENLMFDQSGNLISGISSNVFLVRDKRIVTPDLAACGVAGVVRQFLLDQSQRLGLGEIRLVSGLKLDHIMQYDEVFLSNSIKGIIGVKRIGRHVLVAGQKKATITAKVHHLLGQENAIFSD